MDCVVNPPQPGEPSHEQFLKEKAAVLKSLADRAAMIANAFNSIPGIKCNNVQGAMYAFPQVRSNFISFLHRNIRLISTTTTGANPGEGGSESEIPGSGS